MRAEGRRQKAEGRRQKAEGRRQKAKVLPFEALAKEGRKNLRTYTEGHGGLQSCTEEHERRQKRAGCKEID